ncbi:MAG: fumarylacetoacetate hydrolase family protein [Desulfuromonadales bacterium]
MHTVKLVGTETSFDVRKIVCLARNYADHVRELGNEAPDAPILFLKPGTSLVEEGEKVVVPPYSQLCHHEVELAVLIGKAGKEIPEGEAMTHVAGYGIGLDMTLRDVQNELKSKGLPWEMAKAFDTSCPLSQFVPTSRISDPHSLDISLKVNGEVRQNGNTSMMTRSIPAIIRAVSEIFTLEPGDVILTGTPAGVGAVESGDLMTAEIEGIGILEVGVA